jgi:hypothetical protein
MAKIQKKPITTPKGRLSYPHLFEPQKTRNPNDKPKYSAVFLFTKRDKDGNVLDMSMFKKSLDDAKIQAFGPDKAKWPKNLQSPISDGDAEEHSEREGYKGCWVVKANCNAEFGKPYVVSNQKDENEKWIPITDAKEVYPGCYVRATLVPNVWEFMGKRGVSFILDGVQKLGEGKPFSSKIAAEKAFDPIGDEDLDEELTNDAPDEENEMAF